MTIFTIMLVLPFFAFLVARVIRRLAVRKGWIPPDRMFRYAGAFLPATAPVASGVARVVEATILALAAVIVLASWRVLSGNMASYEHLMAVEIAFACLVAAAGIAVLAAFLGRTGIGVGIMLAAIAVYSTVQIAARPMQMPRSAFSTPEVETTVTYTLDLGGTNVKGADLWVNGIYLGKTPYTTTLTDFEAKVPYWSKLPAEYEKEKVESVHHGPRGPDPEIRDRWIRFPRSACSSQVFVKEPPPIPEEPLPPTDPPRSDAAAKTQETGSHPGRDQTAYYFAKVRYAGEWGLAGPGSSGGGSRSDADWQVNAQFEVIFPQRQKRLKELLNMARVAKYRVSPEWFQAAETYNGDAWIAMGKAAEEEPQMTALRDAWATWRYGLDKADDVESAWVVFQQICDEAEMQQQYLTDSVAGRAVELLVPKLPQERLIKEATQLIRDTSSYQYCRWQSNGRLQFGCRQRPGTFYCGNGSDTGSADFSGNKSQLSVGGFPVVHALWMLDEQFRSSGQSWPNIIQERIAPEIVRWHYKNFALPMMLASYIGGPAIDKFLLRQRWDIPPDPSRPGDQTYVSSREVNKWLYCLAYLNDDVGREFRREHADRFMELADNCCGNDFFVYQNNLDFIFMDRWLAKRYWPRFARLAQQKSINWPLRSQWEYLFCMGDGTTVDMFVEAWKHTNIKNADFYSAFNVLDRLKPSMKRDVIEAVVQDIPKYPEQISHLVKAWGSEDNLISQIMTHNQQAEQDRIFAELQNGPPNDQRSRAGSLRKGVPLWLTHTQPDSPLVAMLAKVDKPELRLIVMGALREYPTPKNQELLEELLKDSDAGVRAAAEKLSQQLKTLAAQNPAEYASDATSVPNTPSTMSVSEEK